MMPPLNRSMLDALRRHFEARNELAVPEWLVRNRAEMRKALNPTIAEQRESLGYLIETGFFDYRLADDDPWRPMQIELVKAGYPEPMPRTEDDASSIE